MNIKTPMNRSVYSAARRIGMSISPGNTKLGEVVSFSLPSLISCPGASSWCRKACYAKGLESRYSNVMKAYFRNWALMRNLRLFAKEMIRSLPKTLTCVRIHVSGDFFSAAYVRAWIKICSAFPDTQFWAYTRSWRVAKLAPELEKLRALPNVHLFASWDASIPEPLPEGWRVARAEKEITGFRCPHETGRVDTCLSCGYCWKPKTKGSLSFLAR